MQCRQLHAPASWSILKIYCLGETPGSESSCLTQAMPVLAKHRTSMIEKFLLENNVYSETFHNVFKKKCTLARNCCEFKLSFSIGKLVLEWARQKRLAAQTAYKCFRFMKFFGKCLTFAHFKNWKTTFSFIEIQREILTENFNLCNCWQPTSAAESAVLIVWSLRSLEI